MALSALEQARGREYPNKHEASPLHQVTDRQMVGLLDCKGVRELFDLSHIDFPVKWQEVSDPDGQGNYIYHETKFLDRKGNPYIAKVERDLQTVAIDVRPSGRDKPILRVALRDRAFDGTPNATPPKYLRAFNAGNYTLEIPTRSRNLGATDWHYSGARDVHPDVMRAIEISVFAAAPDLENLPRFEAKRDKLHVSAEELESFVQNPFKHLPKGNPPSHEDLDRWHTKWWQVVNRTLRGKEVPLPGQTSHKAFDGFLEHVVDGSAQIAKDLDFTHLSAIPTWHYVWEKFQRLGFTPDHPDMHEETRDFFDTLGATQVKYAGRRGETFDVKNHIQSRALTSWLALLPYAIQIDPSYLPNIQVPPDKSEGFYNIFSATRENVIKDGRVLTYPLAPGNNLWLSKEV